MPKIKINNIEYINAPIKNNNFITESHPQAYYKCRLLSFTSGELEFELEQKIEDTEQEFLKLEKIRIISKQATKKVNYYRVNYCDQQKKRGFFFLDSYFRDKKARIQPNLVADFILLRGYKYQFFVRSYLKYV